MNEHRIIGHLDMDAFFAAIEERDRPRLAGRPIVVGADPEDGMGRGVVSTANYAARTYGIHSAMAIREAWHLAEAARKRGEPATVFIAPNGKKYSDESALIMALVRKYVPLIEQASIDEAYLDLSFVRNYEQAEDICRTLQKEIQNKRALTASVGIGPNKLIAKIASDRHKPNGLTVAHEEDAERFLAPMPMRTIPGVGPKTEAVLRERGVTTVRDALPYTKAELQKLLGKFGGDLFENIHGRDDSPLVEVREAKSIGEQETFRNDTLEPGFLIERLGALAHAVGEKFKNEGCKTFRTVVVTVRFADFETKSRSHTLASPTGDVRAIEFEALKLFLPFIDVRENSRKKKVRLLGVRIERFL